MVNKEYKPGRDYDAYPEKTPPIWKDFWGRILIIAIVVAVMAVYFLLPSLFQE